MWKAVFKGEIWTRHFPNRLVHSHEIARWEKVKCTKSRVSSRSVKQSTDQNSHQRSWFTMSKLSNSPVNSRERHPAHQLFKRADYPSFSLSFMWFLHILQKTPEWLCKPAANVSCRLSTNPCTAAECLTNLTQHTHPDERESLVTHYLWLKSETHLTCREHVWTSPQYQLFRNIRKTLKSQKLKMYFKGEMW